MFDKFGANADRAPLWKSVVAGDHPHPPGTHCVTTDENVFSDPPSNPSLSGVDGVHDGVPVGVPQPPLPFVPTIWNS
jgi:hypothetical protein